MIIKLGGSILSYKASPLPKARVSILKRLSRELKQLIEQSSFRLIIIHGVGSFGHPLAKEYNLTDGIPTKKEKLGYCLMEKQDSTLHQLIIKNLLDHNIPAISISPHCFVKTSGKNFAGFDLTIIRGFLNQGLIPVLHGDGVFDDKQGSSILSGDVILPYLACELQAQRAIFLSDVDGVFDKDPKKYPQAKLIPKINDTNLERILLGLTTNNINDVSGEMKGKVIEIKKHLAGLTVHIVNGLKPKSLLRAAAGDSIGTQLLFR